MSATTADRPGVCRACGCTEDAACVDEHGGTCTWADPARTLCTACVDGPPPGCPASPDEWREAVDVCEANLAAARREALLAVRHGTDPALATAADVLLRGLALGYEPRPEEVARIAQEIGGG